ncbi:7-carboxy-7-deazaguanine synthase QueE [Candidatus Omnitrophota bacterium]
MSFPITEIFSSIQGEGLYVGQRHLFVRFKGCNLSCSYCDETAKEGSVLTEREIINALYDLEEKKGPHTFVSLTGGEPLIYADNLIGLCSFLKKDYKIYLETNGVLFQALSSVIALVDVISMDIKLKSIGGDENQFAKNKAFLSCSFEHDKTIFVKIVVSKSTDKKEFIEAVRTIAEVSKAIPLVVQPLTNQEGISNEVLFELHDIALKYLNDVRIIPRLHKILNIC